MFELKLFAKAKTKKFANDKDRKRYYAIKNYYKKKNSEPSIQSTTKNKNKVFKHKDHKIVDISD